jgi:hypothetical protein
MKNSVEVGSSLVETQTTLDYEQEQRQINKMVKNVNDVQSMLNLFSASTEDFSKEMTDTITLCKQYLDNVLEAFNNIQSIKLDDFVNNYTKSQKQINDKIIMSLSSLGDLHQLSEVVQSQISLTDDEKVKRQLAKLSTSMQDLACDRTIINNIVNHVDSIGNIINDVDIKLKDGLVKNFGDAFGSELIPKAIKALSSGNVDITNNNMLTSQLSDSLRSQLEQMQRISENGTQIIDDLEVIDDGVLEKISQLESNNSTLLSAINDTKKQLASAKGTDLNKTVNSLSGMNENLMQVVVQLKDILDADGISEDDSQKVVHSIKDYMSLSEKTSTILDSILNKEGNNNNIGDLISQLNFSTVSIKPIFDDFQKLERTIYLKKLQKSASELKQKITTNNSASNNYVAAYDIRRANSVGSPNLNDSVYFNLTNRLNMDKFSVFGGSNFANHNRELSRTISLGNRQLEQVSKSVATYQDGNESVFDAGVSGNLEHAGQIGIQVADKQVGLLNNLNISWIQYAGMNQEDSADFESMKVSAKQSLDFVNKIVVAFEEIGKHDEVYKALKERQKALKQEVEKVDNLKKPFENLATVFRAMGKAKNLVVGILAGGLSALGIGALFSPLHALETILDRYKANGKMNYQLSMSDASMGLNPSHSRNNAISYGMGQSFFGLTYGQAGFDAPANFYSSLVKNVGGQYNSSPSQNREDMRQFTEQLLPDKLLYDLPDEATQGFIKNFYKDMGMSVSDTVEEFRKLEGSARQSNVPMEKMFATVNQLSSSLRDLGVSAPKVAHAVESITGYNGLRVEDASQMVSETASAKSKMSHDWGRSIFWGIMNGEKDDPFTMVNKGLLSHDENGKPMDSHYDTMVDRLFKESSFFGDRWGGANTPEGALDLQDRLMRQGYTQKQSSVLTNLAQQGKYGEIKEKLKGFDEQNDPMAPVTMTQDMLQQLAQASNQLAESQKIKAEYKKHMNSIANILDTQLGSQLNHFAKWLGLKIDKYAKSMVEVIKMIGGFLNSPFGKSILNTFAEDPIKTTAGVVMAGVAAKKGLGYVLKSSANTIRHPSSIAGGAKSVGVIGLSALAMGVVGASTAFASPQVAPGEEENKNNDNLWWGKISYLFETGKAKVQIVTSSPQDRNNASLEDKIFICATMLGLPMGLYKIYKHFCKSKSLSVPTKPVFNEKKPIFDKQKPPSPGNAPSKKNAKSSSKYRKQKAAYDKLVQANKEFETSKKQYEREVEKYHNSENKFKEDLKRYDAEFEKYKKMSKRQQIKNHIKGFGGNLALAVGQDMLFGDPNQSWGRRIGTDVAEAGAGYLVDATLTALMSRVPGGGLIAKGLRSAIPFIGSSLAMTGANIGINKFFGNTEDDESLARQAKIIKGNMSDVEIEKQQEIMENLASYLGLSNSDFKRYVQTSLATHGVNMGELSEYEKKIWEDKVIEFMGIYGDMAQALNAAAQSLANIRNACANLRTTNGKDLSNAKLVKAADGTMTLDDTSKYTIFGEVQEQWKADDKTKGSWYQRRSGDLSGNASRLFGDIANYYYHTNDESWFTDRANQFHEMANSDDDGDKAYYNFMNGEWGRWKASFQGDNGNRFDSATIGGSESWEFQKFMEWEAEQHYNKEYESYWNTVGSEEIEEKVKEIQAAGNTSIPGTDGDYLGNGEGGFDMTYMEKSESIPGATDLVHVNPKVAAAMNAVAKEFYEKTGHKITITGGAETKKPDGIHWYHHNGTNPGSHGSGAKVDIARDMSADEEDLLEQLIAQHGGAAGVEDSLHLDVSFYSSDGLGGPARYTPNKYLLTGADGRGGGDGSTSNPFPNVKAPKLDISKFKPKSLSEQVEDNSKRFNKALESMGVSNGKTAQGRIVNGMYVDIGSKFESIDSIKKEIDASNKKIQTAIKSGTVEKGNETAKANLKSIEKRVNEELTQHPEEIVKKNWVFRDILKKVDEIAREYMDNPLIATNVNYK